MTIKQQGGIFGRNPTFNDVDMQDLTAATGTVSGNLTANALGIGTTTIEGRAIVEGSGVDVRIYNSDAAANGDSTALIRAYKSTGYWNDLRLSGSNIVFDTFTGERARITNDGLTFNGDTAAANALSDYEEGTFTPSFVAQTGSLGSITYDFQEGNYIKTGNIVHFFINIGTDAVSVGTGSGFLFVTGLPYSPAEDSYLTVGYSANFASNNPTQVFVQSGGSNLYVYSRSTSAATPILVNVSDLGTGADDNRIRFSGSYIAS